MPTETTTTSNESLVATVAETARDRRDPKRRNQFSGPDRRSTTRKAVAFEVSPTGVSIAVLASIKGDEELRLTTDRIDFPADQLPELDAMLDVELLNQQIRDAFTELAERHRLNGASVVIGLGGAPCVTRAVLGDNSEVDTACTELISRSHRYLGLGHGEKVCCSAESPIDAKRKRAWVTIANREIIDAISTSAQSAGLRLAKMEHTLSPFCQAIGSYGFDADEPVLIVATTAAGADLAISFRGQLLLDYHPATRDDSETWSDTVQKHVKCLRRFLQSQVPSSVGQLSKIYLMGCDSVPDDISQQFKERYEIDLIVFPSSMLINSFCVDETPDDSPGTLAAIWMAQAQLANDGKITTDLTDTLQGTERVSIRKLAAVTWPIAATLMICLGLFGWSHNSRQNASVLTSELETLRALKMEAGRVRSELTQTTLISNEFKAVKENLNPVDWQNTVLQAGRLLPEGSWLESLTVQRDLTVMITGSSYSDDAIYDYIKELSNSAVFERVTLSSTRTTRSDTGPATRFEIVAVVSRSARAKTKTVADSDGSHGQYGRIASTDKSQTKSLEDYNG